MRLRLVFVAVLVVVAAGGVAGVCGPLSGSLSTWCVLDSTPVLTDFQSVVQIDYRLSDWTFESKAVFWKDLSPFLFFTADGSFAAWDIDSTVFFVPCAGSTAFRGLLDAAKTSIAGVTVYGFWFVGDNVSESGTIGSALTLGSWGAVGDCAFWTQIQFNAVDTIPVLRLIGYRELLDMFFYFEACAGWVHTPVLFAQTATCSLPWSGASAIFSMPIGCIDVETWLAFTCDEGFTLARFDVYNIDLGIDWLGLGRIRTDFEVDAKLVSTVFSLVTGECVCFTPYLTVNTAAESATGVTLEALVTEYTLNGVTFKAGHRFGDSYWMVWDGALKDQVGIFAFTETGDVISSADAPVAYFCVSSAEYDEYFGIEVDGDACCGGPFDGWVYNWFDTGDGTGIFDWEETVCNLKIGIGSNVTLLFKISLTNSGLNWSKVGLDFVW